MNFLRNSHFYQPEIYLWRIFLITPFLLICILNIPRSVSCGDYYNIEDGNYDYYGDYDNLYDAVNDLDTDPSIYDYYEPDSVSMRPKKSSDESKHPRWVNISQAAETTTECEPVETTPGPTGTTNPPVATSTTAKTTATTECETEEAPTMTTTSTTTTCKPVASKTLAETEIPTAFQAPAVNNDQERKAKELRQLVQHLYIAQARVQLEASEIKKAQAIANEAQQQLEESANHVRAVTAALQNAQQEVASAAIRAQTAQLQLAAHDQLLFAARQDVDALSSQMVGLQAAEGISQPKVNFDIAALMNKLRQPLMESDKPTPVPTITMTGGLTRCNAPAKKPLDFLYYDYYYDY